MEAGTGALDNYAGILWWAQGQAGEAIWLWNQGQAATQQAQTEHDAAVARAMAQNQPAPPFADPGEASRQAARDTLNRARAQLTEGGDIAAGILRGEAGAAPEEPDWLDDLDNTLSAVGAHIVNGVASFGNAMLHHPGEVLAGAGGIGLTALSATGGLAGAALDATGVGAVAGVPLNAVSAAGIATGVGITGAAVASIASHAASDDHVSLVDAGPGAESEEGGATTGEPPKEITGLTEHEEQSRPEGPTYKYRGKDAVVILNQNGEVVTTYAKSTTGLRNP